MLEKEIELVDSIMNDGGVWSYKRQAWNDIKIYLSSIDEKMGKSLDYRECRDPECDGGGNLNLTCDKCGEGLFIE